MKKFYAVRMIRRGGGEEFDKLPIKRGNGEEFDKLEDAIADAQRRQAANADHRYAIMQAILVTVPPVPIVEL